MVNIKEEGIVINQKDFSNSSLIVSILTKNSIKKSLYKGAKKNNIATIGNHIFFQKFGKKDSLGVLSCEIISPYGINYSNPKIITAIFLIASEINHFLQIDEIHNSAIYNNFLNFLNLSWKENLDINAIKKHILLIEFEILQECGILPESISSSDDNFYLFQNVNLQVNKANQDISSLRKLIFS